MKKAIIFDYGGILEIHQVPQFCEWLKNEFELKDDVFPVYRKWEIERDLGHITSHDLYMKICAEFPISLSEEQFFTIYYERFTVPKNDVLDFIKTKLFGKYPLYIFSNNNSLTIEKYEKKTKFSSLFEKCIYSFDLHVRKPHIQFFEEGLKQIQQKGEDCIFFDDQLKSKENSEKCGITFIQFTNLENLKKSLREYGFLTEQSE